MAYRLVATLDGKVRRFPLTLGEHEVGSHPDCALRLAHATVSRRHARLLVTPSEVTIEDLGSRNGIRRDSERIRSMRLVPGVEVRIGGVPIRIEEIPEADLEVAVELWDRPRSTTQVTGPADNTTFASGPAERFLVESLPGLLDRLSGGASPDLVAQLVGETLFEVLPCLRVAIVITDSHGDAAVLFQAVRDEAPTAAPCPVSYPSGASEIRVELPNQLLAEGAAPVLRAAAAIVRLAEARGASDRSAAEAPALPPLPDPPSVDPVVRSIYADAARVARGEVGVLILGESGTGKEVLARYLHQASPRAAGPFLGLDCAALPKDLLEAELFGIERGVATGVEERPGRFEQASGGTLFLDEIGDMALETQAKILRILQSGECYRLGSRRARQVDVRIVAATNRDLHRMLSDGSFRSDLYHRIATWVVELPPLRRRRSDIVNLAAYFVSREARRRRLDVRGLSRAAAEALQRFPWPGNIRQLENEMARAVLFLEPGELLDTVRLAPEIRDATGASTGPVLAAALERTERREITAALEACGGSVDEAADRLGVSRATLYRRLRSLGIEPPT